MYNHLQKYLVEEKILHEKEFSFQTGHSTNHSVVKLVDQIHESFENGHRRLSVFMDLSKAFDTIDHSIRKARNIRHQKLKSFLVSQVSKAKETFMRVTHGLKTDLLFVESHNFQFWDSCYFYHEQTIPIAQVNWIPTCLKMTLIF